MKEEEIDRLRGEMDAVILSLTYIVTMLSLDDEKDRRLLTAAENARLQMREVWGRHPPAPEERDAAEKTIDLIFRAPLS